MYTHMQMHKHTLILQGFISQNIESLSNAGAPHLFVDMIPANSTWYRDKDQPSVGHFIYLGILKMATELPIKFIRIKALASARRD